MPAEDTNSRPKVDKFAALAATQKKQQDPLQPAEVDDLNIQAVSESVTGKQDDDESNKKLPPLADTLSYPEIPLVAPQPVRRDKFASMAAAASSASFDEASDNPQARRPVVDKFAAVQLQKQIDDLKKIRESTIEISKQRDGILADCDRAEDMVVKLLRFVEQTATIYSDDARWKIETPSIKLSRENFSNVLGGYQEALVEVHALLSKHAPHVKAYKNILAEQVDTKSIYVQRVEQRLADTKLGLMQEYVMQDYVSAGKGDTVFPFLVRPELKVLADAGATSSMTDANNKRKRDTGS
jgi:hypothetical protein